MQTTFIHEMEQQLSICVILNEKERTVSHEQHFVHCFHCKTYRMLRFIANSTCVLSADIIVSQLYIKLMPESVLTCAAPLLKVEESSRASVTFGSGDARLTATLTSLITVKRLGTKWVAVTWDARSACSDAVSLRLRTRTDKDKAVRSRNEQNMATAHMLKHIRC